MCATIPSKSPIDFFETERSVHLVSDRSISIKWEAAGANDPPIRWGPTLVAQWRINNEPTRRIRVAERKRIRNEANPRTSKEEMERLTRMDRHRPGRRLKREYLKLLLQFIVANVNGNIFHVQVIVHLNGCPCINFVDRKQRHELVPDIIDPHLRTKLYATIAWQNGHCRGNSNGTGPEHVFEDGAVKV